MQASDIVNLSQLLDQALALRIDDRDSWLASLEGDHQRWRATLRQLLDEHDNPQQPLDSLRMVAPDLSHAVPEEVAGALIGPYRLLRELGRGGMGAVWLVERADGAYQRQLALKLPRLSGDRALDQCLARECEIAARLEHAHIARLYDAGRDTEGRPYLAMQYVAGWPIDQFCRDRGLGVNAKLQLFKTVLNAVAHAHSRLVVHGDIKPSNVMVDGQGQAFLLDFGIAQMLGQIEPAAERQQGMTPAYAAPERLRGEPLSVACDIYSLGRLLHLLLAGRLPDDHGSAVRLPGNLFELDALLAKALHSDPTQRYRSADAMVDDLQRYIDRMPLFAVGTSRAYQLRKRLQRHALGYSLTCLALLSLGSAAYVAQRQARQAEQASRRTLAVKDFLVDILRVNARDSPAKVELRAQPAQALLERGASLIDLKFAAEPDLRAELHGVVGDIFLDMASPQLAQRHARLQGETLAALRAPLAEQAQARLLLIRALIDAQKMSEALSHATALLAWPDLAPRQALEARVLAANALLAQGRDSDTKLELQRAEQQLQTLPTPAPDLQAEVLRLQANRLNYLNNRFDDALPLYRQAIAQIVAQHGAAAPGAFAIQADLVFSLINRRRWPEAEPLLKAALHARRAVGGADDLAAARLEASSLRWLFSTRQLPYVRAKSGIEALRQLFQQRTSVSDTVPALLPAYLDFQLGSVLLEGGEIPRAYDLLEASSKVALAQVEQAWSLHQIQLDLGLVASHTGRHSEAGRLLDEAQRLGVRVVGPNSPWLADGYVAIADNLRMQGRFEEARQFLQRLPPLQAIRGSSHHPESPAEQVQLALARLALDQSDPRGALQLLQSTGDSNDDDLPMQDRQLLRGAALCGTKHARDGLPMMLGQLDRIAADLSPLHPGLADWRAKAGLCALAAGRRHQAIALAAQARASLDNQRGLAPYYRQALGTLQQALSRSGVSP